MKGYQALLSTTWIARALKAGMIPTTSVDYGGKRV